MRLAGWKRAIGAPYGEPHHYEEAVALYTQALETAPAADRHKLLSNRAAAHLKAATREVEAAGAAAAAEAETTALELAAADARECVRLQPAFAKGHYRLGTALTRLQRPAEAVAILEEGLRRAPMNDELRTALRAAREAQETARRAALREAKEGAVESATGSQVKNNKSHPLRWHSAPTRIGVADGVGDDLELKGSGGPGGGAAKSGRRCC